MKLNISPKKAVRATKLKSFCRSAVLILWFLLVGSASAQVSGENKNQPEPSLQINAEDLIHLGDLIDVDVVGTTEYDWRGGLTPEGELDGINFLDEPIYGLCKSESEVAAAIARGYEKFLRNPQVVVKIIDRSKRPISYLYGAVRTPQRFQIQRAVNLNELIILSGGVTEKASGEIQILRSQNLGCGVTDKLTASTADKNDLQSINVSAKQESLTGFINIKISDLLKGEPESNPQILNGDVITVLQSQPIYIAGGVNNPKQINAVSKINISRAIAAAGGLSKNADPKKITLFRIENGATSTVEVDFDKIKSGESEDLILKAFDIVEVSEKGKKRGKYSPLFNLNEKDSEKSDNLPLRLIN